MAITRLGLYGGPRAALVVATTGVLVGTSSLTFSPTGTLTNGADGAISGSSSLTFSPTSTLTGTGTLAGSSTLTFSPTGSLLGTGTLAGSSTLVFSPTSTLTNATPQTLSGTSSLTFSPTGTLTADGVLSGSSDITFTPSGDLTDVNAAPSGGGGGSWDSHKGLAGVKLRPNRFKSKKVEEEIEEVIEDVIEEVKDIEGGDKLSGQAVASVAKKKLLARQQVIRSLRKSESISKKVAERQLEARINELVRKKREFVGPEKLKEEQAKIIARKAALDDAADLEALMYILSEVI